VKPVDQGSIPISVKDDTKHTPKEENKTMRTRAAAFFSAAQILSWGFVCGLLIAPISNLVLRPLIVRLFPSRRRSKRPLAPTSLVRTRHELIVSATPRRPPGFSVSEALPGKKETRTLVDHEPALTRRE